VALSAPTLPGEYLWQGRRNAGECVPLPQLPLLARRMFDGWCPPPLTKFLGGDGGAAPKFSARFCAPLASRAVLLLWSAKAVAVIGFG
jgi:hypothetical protein